MEHPVETPKRIRLRVYGSVQGVGFRAFTRHVARNIGLCGYVRNCEDGSVELEAAGSADQLERLRAAVAKGPPYATVQRVDDLPPTARDLGAVFDIVR